MKLSGRDKLALVLSQCGELVNVGGAAVALGTSRKAAAKLLWRWTRQGWLTRLRRGLYAPVPLEALSQSQVLAQPWVVIPELFDPAYVGGWSAAEHWDLTEQMFRGVMVFTARAGLPTEVAVQGIPFVLKRTQPQRMFGLSPVWHGRARVNVSDIHRTLVDILAEPRLGGGIRHVQDCLTNYQLADQRNWSRLLNYVARLGNGAVYKRLGFLLERQEATETLLDHCASRLTAGNAKLDPNLPCPRLVKRWRLWVPTTWV